MAEAERSPAQWGEEYRERWRLYDAYSSRVRALLVELLETEKIAAVQVDARAKEVQSFVEKVGRKQNKYVDPMREITDLAGVRVIVYYASDVELVGSLIEREFEVDRDNSWRRTLKSDPDRFGYRSDHYVVGTASHRADLGEWRPYAGLSVEVQVRTVLQHAWAAIDHRLNYKRSSEIPTELKRQLFRISALLEVADDQFESVRVAAQELSSSYEQRFSSGELKLPIDRTSIGVYLHQSPMASRWLASATRVGFELGSPDWDHDPDPDDRVGIGELIEASQLVGFSVLLELDQFLGRAEKWGERALSVLYQTRGHDGAWYGSVGFFLATLVYIGSDLSRDQLAAIDGSDRYIDGVLAARDAISESLP